MDGGVARNVANVQARFLYTSSISVFSDRQNGPFTVDAQPDPIDDYRRFRNCMELLPKAGGITLPASGP